MTFTLKETSHLFRITHKLLSTFLAILNYHLQFMNLSQSLTIIQQHGTFSLQQIPFAYILSFLACIPSFLPTSLAIFSLSSLPTGYLNSSIFVALHIITFSTEYAVPLPAPSSLVLQRWAQHSSSCMRQDACRNSVLPRPEYSIYDHHICLFSVS